VSARRSDESGIALLVVLLAITLLTIVVIEFTDTTQVETHLALSTRNALQATYLARSGVNVAEALVAYDPTKGSDSPQDLWAGPFPPLPVGDGSAVFQVRDEARFLNLNDMLSAGQLQAKRVAVFQRLFNQVLKLDPSILAAVRDWLDTDDIPLTNPIGAERSYYLGLIPPTTIRNGPFLTLRELLLVRGVNPTIFARLEKFVTVLPIQNELKVNLNTAPREVLAALSDDMLADPGVVQRVIDTRATTPFDGKNDAFDAVSGLRQALTSDGEEFVDTDSPYFRIESIGEIGDVRRGVLEVVKRDGKKVTRVTWTPATTTLALTSQPPSDFLATLPILGDNR
jgi:general secretion pathway protein K